jgi:hypothetical protein
MCAEKKNKFPSHTHSLRDWSLRRRTDGADKKREPDSANWLVYNETNARHIRRFADRVVENTNTQKI